MDNKENPLFNSSLQHQIRVNQILERANYYYELENIKGWYRCAKNIYQELEATMKDDERKNYKKHLGLSRTNIHKNGKITHEYKEEHIEQTYLILRRVINRIGWFNTEQEDILGSEEW